MCIAVVHFNEVNCCNTEITNVLIVFENRIVPSQPKATAGCDTLLKRITIINNNDLKVAYARRGSSFTIPGRIGKCWFLRKWENAEYPEKGFAKQGSEPTINTSHNWQRAVSPVFEPGPHWWEACALTTAPSLAPGLLREKYTLPRVCFLLDHKVGGNSRRKVEESWKEVPCEQRPLWSS